MHRPRASTLVVLLITAIHAVVAVRGLWSAPLGDLPGSIVRSDVKGYYGYLQAIFLRNDLGHEPYQWEYVRKTPTGTLNKYFCGTAVMMAPWFAIGHSLSFADPDTPKDGLSDMEMRALSVGALVYLLLGLLAVRALLTGLGVRDAPMAWTLGAFGLGTQLMQYAAMQPGWSHVYSFCTIALFLLIVQRLAQGANARWAIPAAMLFAIIVLIRPVNALVILALPIVVGAGAGELLKRLLREPIAILAAMVAGAAVLSLQPLLWYAQVGKWFAYGYHGEGFHWDRPEIIKVLIGFRRGLFLWAPVLLLSAIGTFHMLRTDRRRGVWMLVYWMVNTYVISAWWIWYYGSGFGSRVFVDHYPVLAIPMAMILNGLTGRWWLVVRLYVVACCALLGIQMWQYHAFILHHESMDRAKYVHTFLRWDDRYRGQLAGCYQSPPYNPNGMERLIEESCDFEHACTYWSAGGISRIPIAYSGAHACYFPDGREFGPAFSVPPDSLPIGRALYLEVGLQRFELRSGGSRSLLAVTDVVHADGSHGFYAPFHINPLPPAVCVWEQLEYRIPVPPLDAGDRLNFYFWNKDRDAQVALDDVFMRVSAVNPY